MGGGSGSCRGPGGAVTRFQGSRVAAAAEGRPPHPWADVAMSRLHHSHLWPRPGVWGLCLSLFCAFFQLELPALPCGCGPRPLLAQRLPVAPLWAFSALPRGFLCDPGAGAAGASSGRELPREPSSPLRAFKEADGQWGHPRAAEAEFSRVLGGSSPVCRPLLGAGGGEDREWGLLPGAPGTTLRPWGRWQLPLQPWGRRGGGPCPAGNQQRSWLALGSGV